MKSFAIFIIAILLFFFGFLFLLVEGMERSILSEDYYRAMAEETNFSEHIFDDLKAGFPQEMEENKMASILLEGVEEVITKEWIEENFFLVTDDFLAVINREQDELTVVIDLTEKKKELEEYLVEKMRNIPVRELEEMGITPEEIRTEVSGFLSEGDDFNVINLNEIIGGSEIIDEAGVGLDYFHLFRTYFYLLFFLIFVITFGIIVSFTGIYRGMKVFGITIFLSGLFFYSQLLVWRLLIGNTLGEIKSVLLISEHVINRFSDLPVLFIVFGLLFFGGGFALKKIAEKKVEK